MSEQMIRLAVGLAVPVLVAPFAVLGQRKLFAIFLSEGIELFSTWTLDGEDARTLGTLMAKLNVVVLLLAWLILYTCECFDQDVWIVTGIGLGGLAGAMLITLMTVKSNLEIEGRTLWAVSLLAFAGGNLPLIVLTGVLLAILPRILSLGG